MRKKMLKVLLSFVMVLQMVLMPRVVGAIEVEFTPYQECQVIAEGQFEDQEGRDGVVGAPWRLCDDRTLFVDAGFINWTGFMSPWFGYRNGITNIVFTGPIRAGTSLRSLFSSLDRVREIEGLTYFDTSQVIDMSFMFSGARDLTSLDVSSFDTANVTNMREMFSVSDLFREMFSVSDLSSRSDNLDVPNIDTGNVTTRSPVIWRTNLTNLDVSNFDTSNVTDMSGMFHGSIRLSNLDVSNFDTSNVTDMSYMFSRNGSINLDLSTFNTSNVINMSGMFAHSLWLNILDVSNWDTSSVVDMSDMFWMVWWLTSLDASSWDMSSVVDMSGMFSGTQSLTSLDVSTWDTGSVTDMSYMFSGAYSLTSLDVSTWNTSSVTDMNNMFSWMFWDASMGGLTTLDVSSWDTSSVVNMSRMFSGAYSLTSLDVSNWNTSSVTDMSYMFSGTESLGELTLGEQFIFRGGNLNLPKVRQTAEFTGYWQNVGEGNVENPQGDYVLTSYQLTAPGSRMADTWVWQPTDRLIPTCEVIASGQFTNQPEGISGSEWYLCDNGTLFIDEGFMNWDGDFSPWHAYYTQITEIVIRGEITAGISLRSLFHGLFYVVEIVGLENIDTSSVTDMSEMFSWMRRLTNLDVSTWDTSSVTNMSGMFGVADSLRELDVSSWDTSSVIDMSRMFWVARSLTSLGVSNWDTSSVIDMSEMFSNALSLRELDVSSWDTSSVIDMHGMFGWAHSLTSLDVSTWDTSSVIDMSKMFSGTESLSELTLGEQFIFTGNPELPEIWQTVEFTGYWQNVGNGTTWDPRGEYVLTSAQLTAPGTRLADTWVWQPTEHSIPACEVIVSGQFTNQPEGITGSEWRICEDGTLEINEGFINWTSALSPWNAYQAYITQVDIRGQITAGPSLRALFRGLTEVVAIEGLTYFDTSATTSMYRMFFGASSVTALDVTSFDTSNVVNMGLMFRDASSLTSVNVSGFDTGNVIDMREMFRATQIEELDLSGFDTSSVTNMNHMFTALQTLRVLILGESFSFIGTPNLVPIRQTETYTGLWQGSGVAFTSAQLMAQFDGPTMSGIFVRQEWQQADGCEIVERGRFSNSATVPGAEWRICEDGTLIVDEGFINWTLVTSPWHAYRADITSIVFVGPIITGTSLRSLFHDLSNVETIEGLTYFDTSNVTSMARMFRGASSLVDLDLSNFDTSNVTDMSWMFFGASGLETLDVTDFDTSNVTSMALMFRETSNLTDLDVTNFNTENVTDMREMFRGMSSLEVLDLSSFDTGRVTNMNHMFVGLTSLNELILGELFRPIGNPGLPTIRETAGFTGR